MDNNTNESVKAPQQSLLDKNISGADNTSNINKTIDGLMDTSTLAVQNSAPTLPTPVGSAATPPVVNKTATAVSASAPLIADDNDLIEKEWIQKAKDILKHNRKDPHEQNDQMSAYKADYMKKRYNKDIKLTEND